MDWFSWENLQPETMVFTMKFDGVSNMIGLSGENFPIIQFYDIHR